MAAAGLHETYTMFRRQGLSELRLDPDTTESSSDGVWFNDLMRSAVRRAYWPGPVVVGPGQVVTPDWTFLKQMADLTVYGEYATGTVDVDSTLATVLLNDGVWPSWLSSFEETPIITIYEDDGTAIESNVLTRDSDTQITLDANWTGSTDTGLSYSLSPPESYAVYDSLVGPAIITDPLPVRELPITDWMRVRKNQAISTGFIGNAGIIGLRPGMKSLGSAVQTFRMNIWPQFDGTIKYRYRVTPSMIDAADTLPETYAYGPPWFHEVMLESVLAVCEERRDGVKGLHNQNFQAAMVSAVLADMHNEPDVYGTIVREGAKASAGWSSLDHFWPRSSEAVYTP